jgi:hypothetical protein
MSSRALVEDSTMLRLIWRPRKIGEVVINMTLEARLVRAHLALRVASKDIHDLGFVSLARYGSYDVRLVEPEQTSSFNPFDFWLELFDLDRRISVDGGGANDLEAALAIAEELVSSAQELNKK